MVLLYGKLNECLETILGSLVEDEALGRMLFYDKLDKDFLKKDKPSMRDLVGTKIYKRNVVCEVQQDMKVILGLRIESVSYNNKHTTTIDKIIVGINIICHQSLCDTGIGQRDLAIASCIHKIFNDGRIGIGKCRHYLTKNLTALKTFYVGYDVMYEITDFTERNRV